MKQIKWTKALDIGVETVIDGFKVSRVTCQSGTKLYFVHWFENPDYAAPYCRMSDKIFSMSSVKKRIAYIKTMPNCVPRLSKRVG